MAARSGTRRFGGGSGSGTARLQRDGALEVSVVTLDEYCRRHAVHPTLVKECLSLLSDLGYLAEQVGGGQLATADELLCTPHTGQAIHPGKQEEARG